MKARKDLVIFYDNIIIMFYSLSIQKIVSLSLKSRYKEEKYLFQFNRS